MEQNVGTQIVTALQATAEALEAIALTLPDGPRKRVEAQANRIRGAKAGIAAEVT